MGKRAGAVASKANGIDVLLPIRLDQHRHEYIDGLYRGKRDNRRYNVPAGALHRW
jgi:hypothetical protein